jgi:hypothetical protein
VQVAPLQEGKPWTASNRLLSAVEWQHLNLDDTLGSTKEARNMPRIIATLFLLSSAALFAQNTPRPEFDVADIRLNASGQDAGSFEKY